MAQMTLELVNDIAALLLVTLGIVISCLGIVIIISDIKSKRAIKYVHFKTGKVYTVLHRAFGVTDNENNPVVVYRDNEYVYVRDERDFYEKFTAL